MKHNKTTQLPKSGPTLQTCMHPQPHVYNCSVSSSPHHTCSLERTCCARLTTAKWPLPRFSSRSYISTNCGCDAIPAHTPHITLVHTHAHHMHISRSGIGYAGRGVSGVSAHICSSRENTTLIGRSCARDTHMHTRQSLPPHPST